ncbi:MAG: hypothetical protein K0R02_1231, partial [Rickettsiaceae bacterium]|nr:hypothetical protein [Rickettsiaceae bacterium]
MVGKKRELENSNNNSQELTVKRLKENETYVGEITPDENLIKNIQSAIDNDNALLLYNLLGKLTKENIYIPITLEGIDRKLSLLFYCSYKGAF